jgi:hypothetical protein
MSNSREKKPADKKSIQFSCRNTEIQQWWHLGTHTHNLSMNSRERRGWGGMHSKKKFTLSQLAIQQINAFSKPGRKHTHTWGQNLNFFSA